MERVWGGNATAKKRSKLVTHKERFSSPNQMGDRKAENSGDHEKKNVKPGKKTKKQGSKEADRNGEVEGVVRKSRFQQAKQSQRGRGIQMVLPAMGIGKAHYLKKTSRSGRSRLKTLRKGERKIQSNIYASKTKVNKQYGKGE